MAMDVSITLTVFVPQLDTLGHTLLSIGESIVAELTGIITALETLTTNQTNGQTALSAHLTAIEEEIRQLGEAPTQAQLDAIADQINAAAAISAQGVADLQAMTEQIKGMVPDTPAP